MKKHVVAAASAVCLSWALLFTVSVQAQQTGRLNIDCGALRPYQDKDGLYYDTDDTYIESGTIFNLSSASNDESIKKSYWNLRSFPTDKRNCYRIKSVKGTKYLIRAEFYYGNYDKLKRPPQFDLYIGTNFWKTINLTRPDSEYSTELITNATSDLLHICLLNTDKGIPFISAIRLITLPRNLYQQFTSSWSLILCNRSNLGSLSSVRYPDDPFLRIWDGWSIYDTINTTSDVDNSNDFQPPSKVVQTASVPKDNEDSLDWRWTELVNSSDQYHIALHFVELENLGRNESREFNIYLGGDLFYGPLKPDYLSLNTIYTTDPMYVTDFHIVINKTSNSTRPPLINALEVFQVKKFMDSTTDRKDVEAIMGIKDTYKIKKNWMGDPCLPKDFPWSGLICNDNDPPRITALNLSFSELVGNISHHLANISSIESIDLSNNNLTGSIPEFLSQLTSLKVLNLSKNQLSGSIPDSLKEGNRPKSLVLITDIVERDGKNPTKKKIHVRILIASTIGAAVFSLIAFIIFCIFRRKSREKSLSKDNKNTFHRQLRKMESEYKRFTYKEILKMTKNFEHVIGKGGFGTVFNGYLNDGTRVAVKVLSESSAHQFKEFSSETSLMMRIHHKNLVSFVGYCIEDTNMALIYEYMDRGNLRTVLSSDSDEKLNILSWKQRLLVALNSAQGLEYLHRGCNPPIIHRDIKTANILLNEKLEAKISDFDFSKIYPLDGLSHVSTDVMGTPGYIDPEYYRLGHLNEKSDVYSFGIVLLELITGEHPIDKTSENVHIVRRVSSTLQNGDIRDVVDPKLEGNFDIKSAWKLVQIAFECTSLNSVRRPDMSQVVIELNKLMEETSIYNERFKGETESDNLSNQYLDTEPLAR